MFNNITPTLMQLINEKEIADFIVTNSKEALASAKGEDFVDGNVLYKCLVRRTGIQALISQYTLANTNKEDINARSVDRLFRNVTEQLINDQGDYTWKQALLRIEKYRAALGKNFFGAVIRSKSKKSVIINPYHPLAALSLMGEADQTVESYKYNIIVYVYSDREKMDKHYNTSLANTKDIESNIKGIISTYTNRVNTEIKVEGASNSQLDSRGNITLNYKVKKHPDEEPNNDHLIVATQIVTSGVLAPWYGTSLIKKPLNGDSSSGIHLGPIRSCNISGIRGKNASYNGVCTGSLSNRTLKGLRSLSHANLSSPFSREIIFDGGLAYIDAMIEQSVQLYKLGKIL